MAYLYQKIMNVPGLSGTSGQRQQQYFQKLGGKGSYTGSLQQNTWLLNQMNRPSYGLSGMAGGGNSAGGQATIPGTDIPVPNARTAFSEVLPYDKVFNPDDISALANSQIQPEIGRQQNMAMGDLNKNLALSGAYRTGQAGVQRGNLLDNYSRQLKEQTAGFTGQVNNWATDWYNKTSENYYKNPAAWKMPTLPTFADYLKTNPVLSTAY